MKKRWKPYAVFILLAEAAGALSGWLSREGMKVYQAAAEKPPLSPPGAVFPVVWGILYALMGAGAARVYQAPASRERTGALRLFSLQLAFNFFWSILFFRFRRYGAALLWLAALWVLILWMILAFRKVDRLTARLQIPYLLWAAFALYLNAGVWLLN